MSTIHDNSKSKKINKTLEMNNMQLEKLHTGRRYFYFYYDFLEVMTKLEAMFLQDLINRATLPATKREVENDDVYFQCTMTFLQCPKFATWTENEQRAHLASLTSKGFIKTMRRGGKATRWVHIDYVTIHRAINEAVKETENTDDEGEDNQSRGFQRDSKNQSRGFQRDQSRGFQRLKKTSTNVDVLNNKEERNPARFSIPHDGFKFGQNDTVTKKKPNPVIDQKYIDAHKRLREILHSAEPTRYVAKVGNKSGAEHLRLLCEVNLQGDFSVIEELLEDYAEYINEIPKPSISGAEQLRQQFAWLQGKINECKGVGTRGNESLNG